MTPNLNLTERKILIYKICNSSGILTTNDSIITTNTHV